MSSPPIISELRNLGRRLKAISFLNGSAQLLSAVIAGLLAIITIDYLLRLSPTARIALLILDLAAIAWLTIYQIALPLFRKIPLPFLAARLEKIFPQFAGRLRSTIDFTAADIPGSSAMKDRVIAETSDLFQQVNLRRAVSLKPLYRSLSAAAIALLVAALLALLTSPFYRHLALDRFLHPFTAPAWPRTVQIELLGPLPARIPTGQTLNIRMKLSRGDRPARKAILFSQLDGGAVQQQYMNRQPDGSYTAALDTQLGPSASGKLHAWISAGDDSMQLPNVAIVPRLAIQSITAQIQPPAYANLPPLNADLSAGPVSSVVGSHITLNIRFNKPLDSTAPSLDPIADTLATKPTWKRPSATSASAEWTLRRSLQFHLRATDADGFANSAAAEYQIIARTDQPPVIQIENPQRNEERTPDAVIPLQISAADDFGIAAITLHPIPHSLTAEQKAQYLPLITNFTSTQPNVTFTKTESTPDQQRYRLDYLWPLAALHLSPGDTLEYSALAQDNYELNGQHHIPVSSNTLRITIVSQQQLSEHIAEQMRQIAQQVSQVRTAQTRTIQETQTLAHDTLTKSKLDSADRAMLSRLADQQGAHAAETKQLADQLANLFQQLQENRSPNDDLKQTAADAGNLLNQAAENAMKQSAAALSQLRDSSAAPQRHEQFSQIQSQQSQSSDQLQRALDSLGAAGSLDQTIQQIANLLKSQQNISHQTSALAANNLGKTPDQMSPADQKRLAENAANQKALADRTAATIAQMSRQAGPLAQSDPATAAALSQAASAAEQQQISPSQQRASQALSQNEQSDAQSSQSQAEIGLQTVLSQLHEAQRRQLAELSRHLADLQSQIARLVRRQASHNLDDLTLQGPRTSEKKTRDDLFQLSRGVHAPHPSADHAPPPSLSALTISQEKTHRNTRSLAGSTDQLPAATEVAGLLLQSADNMERAGVFLQQNQLQAAFDPPQSEALSLLLSAQKKLARIKADLDHRLAGQSRQSLRDAYVKLKADQLAINSQTMQIDHSPRRADGSLDRISTIQLLQLSPAQQHLAQRVAKLNDRISTLGGIIYLWANNDIHDAMTNVAAALEHFPRNTGGYSSLPLQTQNQIVANLDAMIQSLSVEPRQQEFAQRDSGGGGSGGGKQSQKPHLPPEAELRLMRQFEQNLKTQTADSNRLPPSAASLSALGQRQGQLRGLLNQLLQQASRGQLKLPPETPNQNILPEEKKPGSTDDDLANQLLTEPAATDNSGDQSVHRLGDRMSRVSQRLALNHDSGLITQTIEQNILTGLDQLIEQARQQQSQSSPQNQQPNPEQNPQITLNPPQQPSSASVGSPLKSSSPARSSNVAGSAAAQTDLTQDIRQNMRQWGGLSDRQRQAVLDGANDAVIEKYKPLIDDYYRNLADKK